MCQFDCHFMRSNIYIRSTCSLTYSSQQLQQSAIGFNRISFGNSLTLSMSDCDANSHTHIQIQALQHMNETKVWSNNNNNIKNILNTHTQRDTNKKTRVSFSWE